MKRRRNDDGTRIESGARPDMRGTFGGRFR
jgi:hypothetical protein